MALLLGSPAINAGDNATCLSTDQRGITRPQGAVCDIGAYEVDNFCATQSEIPITECNALIDLYNSTNGPAWSDSPGNNWNVTNTPCSWVGVGCSSIPGNVIWITRDSKNLVGNLPTSLSALTSLTSLNLSYNQLSGSIPSLPASLTSLDLSINQLSGSIPSLPASLTHLDLWDNQLSGTIPTLPTSLGFLRLDNNQLTGTIPPLPTGLGFLRLDWNQLTGTIPPLPTGLNLLYLHENQLTGTIPDLSALTNLDSLVLANNQLTGTIPPLPSSLQTLDLYNNQLSGSIPSLPASLTYLDLRSNQLSGTIPDLSALTSLEWLILDNNQLTGTIPNLPNSLGLGTSGSPGCCLRLENNQLTGIIPDLSTTALTVPYVDLKCNQFTGETGTSATALDPDWAICSLSTPGYGSPPLPGMITNVGTSLVGTPITTDLTLSEVGTADLIVGFTAINGTHATDFKVNTALFPLTIAEGGAAVPLTVTCTPSATGVRTATLELTSNDPNYPTISYPLSCNGILPSYQSTPAVNTTLVIGETLVKNSVSKTFAVTEQGFGDLIVSNPLITGTHASDFKVITPTFPFTIIDNSSVAKAITIRCTPSALGLRTATLELTSNDPNNSKPTYPLQCTGFAVAAGYQATLSTTELLDFGSQPPGVATTRSFDISETGNATLTVELLGLERDSHELADFTILSPSFPITLADGSNPVTVTIQCNPAGVGSHYAQLKLATNDPSNPNPTYTLNCIGEATVPAYDSLPSPNTTLTFSGLNNHTASLTISEVGKGVLEITKATFIGDLGANFSITTGQPPITLADGAPSQTLTVQCAPNGINKVITATLQLATNDVKQPLVSYPLICVDFHHNHAPTDILLSNATIQPKSTVDTVIVTLSTIDPIEMVNLPKIDIATTCSLCHDSSRATTPAIHNYTLIDNANGLFKIIGNQLLIAQPLIDAKSYTITVRSTDAGGLSFDKIFTLETSVTNAIYTSLPAPSETIRLSTTSLETPAQATLVITNIGQAELQVGFMEITGEQANDFQVINPQFPINLTPQGTQTVTLSCLPNQSGLSLATLTLISSDTTLSAPTYPLICALEKSGPGFSSAPLPGSVLSFEKTPLGQTVTTDLSIVEIGNETLTIAQAEITGLDVAYFKLSETTFAIANGEPPHVLKIHCTPQVVGQQVATLTLVTNDSTQLVVNYELTCTSISETTSEIYLSNQAIDENIPGDSFIGRLTTDNIDPEERHQYTLINDSQGKFSVIGDGLYTLPNAVFDFATQDRYLITVRSTNTLGISFTKDFIISIHEVAKTKIYGQIITDLGDKGSHITIDSPERMTLSVIIESLPEEIGQMANISMSARWTPIDTNKVITIKRPIQRKPLSEHLELILYTGSLPGASGIFHVDVSYQLDDGTEVSATNIATLQVRRNRPPTKVMLSANHVGGNSPPETVVGILSATDPDKSERFRYVVLDSKYFMAVGNELRRAYSFPPRFANTNQIPVTIRAMDNSDGFIEQEFTIFINQ